MNNYKAESDNALKEKPYIVFDKKEDGGEIRLALGDENNLRVTRVYAVDGDGAVIYDRQVPVKEAFGEAYKRIEGNYYDYMRHNYRYFALAEAANACAAIGDHEAVNKILGMVQDEKKSFDRKVYRARGRKPLPSGMGRKLAPH